MTDPMAALIKPIQEVSHLPEPALFALCMALLKGIGGVSLAVGLAIRSRAALMAVQMLASTHIFGPT